MYALAAISCANYVSPVQKTPERIVEALFPVTTEVAGNIVNTNFLGVPDFSAVQAQNPTPEARITIALKTRFVLSAHILANLLCQDEINTVVPEG